MMSAPRSSPVEAGVQMVSGTGRAASTMAVKEAVSSGPAHRANRYGASGGVGSNRHTPSALSGGRAATGKLDRQHHPAGARTATLIGARRSGWSKQQKIRAAP